MVRRALHLPSHSLRTYEERVTIWRARGVSDAIVEAEREAGDYADGLADVRYVGLAQAFHMFDEPENGAEVFSLMRQSDLEPDAYVARFFDTGSERQDQL